MKMGILTRLLLALCGFTALQMASARAERQLDPRLRIISVREVDPEMGVFVTTPGVDCTKAANEIIFNSPTSLSVAKQRRQVAAYRRANRSMVRANSKELHGLCKITVGAEDGVLK